MLGVAAVDEDVLLDTVSVEIDVHDYSALVTHTFHHLLHGKDRGVQVLICRFTRYSVYLLYWCLVNCFTGFTGAW
jgi:hypothetical protein